MSKKYPMTLIGKKKLEEKLAYLKQGKQKEISNEIKHLRSFCHSSEDASFNEMLDQQYVLKDQIKQIEEMLYNSEMITPKQGQTSVVMIGSTVTYREVSNGREETYTIVGTTDANPTEHQISMESPIGKRLLGSKKNDHIIIDIPSGKMKVKVINIR